MCKTREGWPSAIESRAVVQSPAALDSNPGSLEVKGRLSQPGSSPLECAVGDQISLEQDGQAGGCSTWDSRLAATLPPMVAAIGAAQTGLSKPLS